VRSETFAANLSAAARTLSTMDRGLPAYEASPGSFGADGGGVPGQVGRALHAHWVAVLTARAREAADAAARLDDLADSVRATKRDYSDTDESAARHIHRAAP
jgi:hypothetical protein